MSPEPVWLPGIWGSPAEDAPQCETTEQAQRIMDLVLRHYNGIVWSLQGDADASEPVFNTTTYLDDVEYIDGESWEYGFMRRLELCRPDWQPLFDDAQAESQLRPIYLMGADEVSAEDEELTSRPAQCEELSRKIPMNISAIYCYWRPYRKAVSERQIATMIQRATPKFGRNDLCPRGSGKKFKKCCGAASALH
ncbi:MULTISPECIES: UPF0149 family protein [unclassified Caballeronia]|uniref:UPF0149 family protein n=1 Tax=unclassified Caballeronia TaxID=2646786 RepID=UPI0020293D8A